MGSSSNLKVRKHAHFNTLQNGKHGNTHLQRAYNKYGKENFKWEILEFIIKSEDKIWG